MAKTKRLILLPLFILFGIVTVIAGTGQMPMTITAKADSLTVTTGTDYYDDIINIKVKELHLFITPSFKVTLPDANVNLGLKQKIGDTILEGMTEYNYIYNKIKYLLKYGLETYFPVYLSLYDNLEFEAVYNNTKYIQRTKGLGISVGTPILFSVLKFGEAFRNENAYLANLNNSLEVQQGLASIINTWMEVKIIGKQGGNEFDEMRLNVDIDKAIPHKYSPYNFMFLNCSLITNLRFENGNNLLFNVETGYMLDASNVPLWKIYSLGGFDRLIGYGLNQFQDYYKVFGRLRFDGLIADKIGWELWWLKLDNLKAFAIVDCGKTGNVHQIQEYGSYKYGVGAGVSFQFTFRKRTPIKVTLAVGQAIETSTPPVVYFIYELL